jgi:hypothetical protein
MANVTDGHRSARHSRSVRAVTLLQIATWCAVGALLILRGVATLTSDETLSSSDNKTTSVIVATRDLNGTNSSTAVSENEGKSIPKSLW